MPIATQIPATPPAPMTYAQELARQIAEASISGSGNFFACPGQGVAVLKELFGTIGFKGGRIQANFTIASNLPNGANAPGSSAVVMFKVGHSDRTKAEFLMGKAKELVLALAGVKESEVSAEELSDEIGRVVTKKGRETPRAGTKVAFECFKASDGSGRDYVSFSPLTE